MNALTINAWLNKDVPSISLINRISGQLIACWQGPAVEQLFDQGLVTLQELYSSDKAITARLSHDLLLAACASSLCMKQSDGCFNCITGRLLQSYMQTDAAKTTTKVSQIQPLSLTG